jgi:hypothetical protein
MGQPQQRKGPPAALIKQVDARRAAAVPASAKNKNLLGHIERRRNRRKFNFDQRHAPAPVPVPVPPKSEKNKYWFRQVEVFAVVPQRLIIPAGKERKFSVGIPTWVTLCAAQPNPESGDIARTTLEVATSNADANDASAALLSMFGAEGAMNSAMAKRIRADAEARAKRPAWMSLGTVTNATPSTVVKHVLHPGAHSLRANGAGSVLVALFAKGRTVKLV